MRGKGCAECAGTGYRGRMGVFEVLPITAELRKVLLTTPTEAAIGTAARAHGMMTLRASALAAAHRGETTYEEVLRATTVDTVSSHRCPSCARALADDMVCCPYDGTPVARGRCASCDKQLDAEWRTCPFCRTPVERPPTPCRRGAAHPPARRRRRPERVRVRHDGPHRDGGGDDRADARRTGWRWWAPRSSTPCSSTTAARPVAASS
jgi:hypothetical protein